MAKPVYKKRFSTHELMTSSISQIWRLLVGIMVIAIGGLILLSNLPASLTARQPDSTPIIIRDGLIIRSSRSTLYMFKRYVLHQIVNPTAGQQSQAKFVSDSFLREYTHGVPVDQNGRPEPNIQPESLPPPPALANKEEIAFDFPSVGWWVLGLTLVIIGGGWLLVQLFHSSNGQGHVGFKGPLEQVTHYTEQIAQILKANPNQQQHQLLKNIAHWQQMIYVLGQRLENLRQNELLHQDLSKVPDLITKLEQQLALETQPVLQAELEHTLRQRKSQLISLERLQIMMQQAEMQIGTIVALLGTIYSQLLTQQSTAQVADYAHLMAEVNEEIQCLQDHLSALEEVKMRKIEPLA